MHLNLIHLFDFYCMFMFVASTWRRAKQYSQLGQLVFAGPGGWPRLLKLVREHRTIFLTWRTVAPAILTLGLTVLQLLASRKFWPQAEASADELNFAKLLNNYAGLAFILPLAAAVLTIDVYFLIAVGRIDRPMLEKYFDQAEYWLASPAATVVKIVTFGVINPRRMVAEETKKALVQASDLLNGNLWWVILQVCLRFSFGLSLWIAWWRG